MVMCRCQVALPTRSNLIIAVGKPPQGCVYAATARTFGAAPVRLNARSYGVAPSAARPRPARSLAIRLQFCEKRGVGPACSDLISTPDVSRRSGRGEHRHAVFRLSDHSAAEAVPYRYAYTLPGRQGAGQTSASRGGLGDDDIRMIFAQQQGEAERLLSMPRDERVIGED